MAAKTLYLTDTLSSTSTQHLLLQDGGTAPSTATTNTAWTNGTVASGNFSPMVPQTKQGTGTFGATSLPGATCVFTDVDFYVSGFYTGDFVAGNWVITVPLVGSQTNGSVRIRARIFAFKGDTLVFRELTSGSTAGTTYSVTTTAGTSVVTISMPAVHLANEAICIKIACETVSAGSNSTRFVSVRTGSSGACVTTSYTAGTEGTSSTEVPITSSAVASFPVTASSTVTTAITSSAVASFPVLAASTCQVSVGGSAVASFPVTAVSNKEAGIASSAAAAFDVSAASTTETGVAGTAAATVETHADTSKQVTVGGSATGTVSTPGGRPYIVGTIDPAKVGASDLTNFTFPIYFAPNEVPELKDVAHGGLMESSSGFDALVWDGTRTTQWDFERRFYDPATGELLLWARAPGVNGNTHMTGTDYAVTWGDSGITTDQSTTATWNSDAVATWHYSETSTAGGSSMTGLEDATGNGHNGAGHGDLLWASGKIGGGIQTNSAAGAQGYVGATVSSRLGGDFTIRGWLKTADHDQDQDCVLVSSQVASYGNYWLAISGSDIFAGLGKLRVNLYDGTHNPFVDSTTTVPNGTWMRFAMRRDTVAGRIYVNINGSTEASAVDSTTTVPGYSGFNVGTQVTPDRRYNGVIDEVFVSDVALSDDWLFAEYNSQADTTTFSTRGSVQYTGELVAASTQQVPVTSSAAASFPVTADSSQQVPVAISAAAAVESHADSSALVPVSPSAVATVETHADSTASVPVTSAATATVATHADSSVQVPVTSAAVAVVITHADSTQQVAVTPTSAAALGISAASTDQVPVVSSAAAAVETHADSTRDVPVASSAAATLETHAASTVEVPLGGIIEVEETEAGEARSHVQVPVIAAGTATIETHADSTATVPVIPSATAAFDVTADSTQEVPVTPTSVAILEVHAQTNKPVPVGGTATAVVASHAVSATDVPVYSDAHATIETHAASERLVPVGGIIIVRLTDVEVCPPELPIDIGERPDSGSGPADAIIAIEPPAAEPIASVIDVAAEPIAVMVGAGASPIAVADRPAAEPIASGNRPCGATADPWQPWEPDA